MRTRFSLFTLLLFVLILGATACNSAPAKPSVVINAPPHGSQFREGEEISFQSTATDAKGVTRVELLVDGATVRTDSPPNAQGQPSFTLVQAWKAAQGSHTVSVRAFNADNVVSDPAVISISVAAAPSVPTSIPVVSQPPTLPAPPTVAPTTAPTQASSSSSSAAACTNNAAFVADVTVPDGTAFVANQAFNKIWRVKNSGTCAWGTGYSFVFAAGELMGAPTSIAVPNTNAGSTADLLVAMAAPATVGTHTGQWKLKGSNGTLFGTTLTVVINVIDPNAPANPTLAPTTVPPTPAPQTGACSGAPAITTFTASPTGALFFPVSVTLSWGEVTNADSVEIDGGVGGVGTPGNVTVNVTGPKTFTLTAKCGSTTAIRQVTISKNTLPLITVIPPFQIFLVGNVTATGSASGVLCGLKSYEFTGQISATGTGDVQYRWEKNGVAGPSGSLHFAASGTKDVTHYTFNPGTTGGNVLLRVTAPTNKASSSVPYTGCMTVSPIFP